MHARAAAGLAFLFLVLSPGCKDKSKQSAQEAAENVRTLIALAGKDADEIQRGMPEGAKRLAPMFAKGADPLEPSAVRTRINKVHREVPDLNVAKSTFFALADDKGVALRNDLEVDTMAGQDLVGIFPELKKATGGSYVETVGAFPGAVSPTQGQDRDWIAAAPVKRDDGTVGAIFVTGWAFRRFAFHLQEQLKHDLAEQLRSAHDTGKLPVLYVALFDRTGVYAATQTPAVNEKALADEKLFDKTSSGPTQGVLTVTERDFGYAAARATRLGADVGIAVLRSEI